MFGMRKTLGSILGTFTKTISDLETYVSNCVKDVEESQAKVLAENLKIEENKGNTSKANKVLANLRKIIEE